MNLHPTLKRQVHKHFGDQVPEDITPLLEAVSRTYDGFDQDHKLVERSLEVSSQELGERIAQLRQTQAQLEAEKTSIEQKIQERTLQLSQAQAQLEASIRALSFGFALINTNREIVFHNQVLEELIGLDIPPEVHDTAFAFSQIVDYFAPAIDLVDAVTQTVSNRTRLEQEIALGSNYYRLLLLPIQVTEGAAVQTLGAVLVVENVTDAKAQERSRDEFFSIASHELRTPLTAIKGNATMITDFFAGDIKNPEVLNMLHDIHESSVRLISIVNDFLSASRLEQGKMVFRLAPFDVCALTKSIVDEYSSTARDAGVELSYSAKDPAQVAMGDTDRVRQIITNLVSNALKFTTQGSVKITIEPVDTIIRLRVIDSGQGIPLESQHLLFRKFQQATNNILTRDNTKGTGLGLYISQLMAENMHGRLFLEQTQIGQGSTFALDLPVAGSKDSVPEQKPTSTITTEGAHDADSTIR